ncbi:MAG: toxin [bacterium]|jgi:uncharacterized DUF497 family protein
MNLFRWEESKNEWLKSNRDVCFEQIVILMEQAALLDVIDNPNQDKYPGQKIAVASINDYVYLVPYEQKGEEIELKTIIPSRKATRKYLGGSYEKDNS